MSESPLLPPHYELVRLDAVDSVMDEARRRAEAGAGEGTLVQALEQRAARTRHGHRWHAPAGNLHCALVLEPEYPNAGAWQLAYVAALAVGAATAELVEAMTGLRYGWPNKLLINELLAGRVELAAPAGAGDPYPWLVVGWSVNVAEHPPQSEPERFNSLHASGSPDVDTEALLEGSTRWFLHWINRWAEDGFEPVRHAWTMRANGIGDPAAIAVGDDTVAGRLAGIDDAGCAVIETAEHGTRAVSVGAYFGIDR